MNVVTHIRLWLSMSNVHMGMWWPINGDVVAHMMVAHMGMWMSIWGCGGPYMGMWRSIWGCGGSYVNVVYRMEMLWLTLGCGGSYRDVVARMGMMKLMWE